VRAWSRSGRKSAFGSVRLLAEFFRWPVTSAAAKWGVHDPGWQMGFRCWRSASSRAGAREGRWGLAIYPIAALKLLLIITVACVSARPQGVPFLQRAFFALRLRPDPAGSRSASAFGLSCSRHWIISTVQSSRACSADEWVVRVVCQGGAGPQCWCEINRPPRVFELQQPRMPTANALVGQACSRSRA